MARRIKARNEKERDRSASNQFPKCSLPSRTHTEIHRVLGREDKGEGGDRGDLVEKRRIQRRKEQSSQ